MGSDDDLIIRNGTLKQLLFYYDVKIGGKPYRAWKVIGALVLVGFVAGAWVF
jgi:hypothetical protein